MLVEPLEDPESMCFPARACVTVGKQGTIWVPLLNLDNGAVRVPARVVLGTLEAPGDVESGDMVIPRWVSEETLLSILEDIGGTSGGDCGAVDASDETEAGRKPAG